MGENLLVYGDDSTKTPTTMQQMQEFMVQEAETVGDLVDGLLWQPNTTYKTGTVIHSANLPAGYIAEAVTQGQTGNNEPTWIESVERYSDGTVSWKLIKQLGVRTINNVKPDTSGNIIFDPIPVGVIFPFASNGNIPAGYLPCEGGNVRRILYPKLFDVIGYTYGGSGDYFGLPNLSGKFIEGGTIAGEEHEAGLPNITGKLNTTTTSTSLAFIFEGAATAVETDGVFEITETRRNRGASDSDSNYTGIKTLEFDASKSNEIYGNSETVQPPAVTMRYIIKAV